MKTSIFSGFNSQKMATIAYQPLLTSHTSEVAAFLLDSFFHEEPLGQALGLPLDQVSRWLASFLEPILAHGMSFMAVDSNKNILIGVSVNMIFRPNGENTLMSDYADPVKEPIMFKILRFLGNLNADLNRPNRPDRILRILFLNVLSSYGRQGIAKALAAKSEEHALSAGISSFQVDTTSEFSYRAYMALGYNVLREWKFADYEEDGVKLLENSNMGVHQLARILYKVF